MIAKFKQRSRRPLLRAVAALGLGLIALADASSRTDAAVPGATSPDQPSPRAASVGPSASDAALASQKIQSLGVRDDTRPYEERPYDWLWDRREQLTGPLIAGLQSTNLETARQCLRILDGTKTSPALEQALLAVASDPHHQLRPEAILSLCRFVGDPRARALLESMWTNTLVFPDAGRRATLAEAVGHRPEAAALLTSLLLTNQESWACVDIIRRLGTNGTPAALATLSQAASDKRWLVAAQARLALASADPQGHALTAAQADFLENSRFWGKETDESHRARFAKLAMLPQEEIRSLLRHMLNTDQAGDAALICGLAHGRAGDSTYVPFFTSAASTDPEVRARYVQGRKVACFPNRQAAAQNLARLTGKPATYLGLKGETLGHDQSPPQPYPDQDQLVARHVLDRIQAAHLKQPPVSDSDWARVGYFNSLIARLTSEEQFGSDLKAALLQEAQRRQLELDLKAAGCALWH